VIPASTSSHLRLGEGAEFDAIRSMLGEWGSRAAGIGDDGALLDVPAGERLVVSTDASIENVHFRREWLSAQQIGARAAAAALSDLAAMAATPLGLLLALGVPPDWQAELTELARGVGVAAERAGCAIVGGNIARSSALSLTFTVLGSTSQALHRAGAKAGDIVYVTGRLGGAGAALASLLAGRVPRPAHMERFVAPVPRLAESRWLVEHGVHAGIDLSDGLLADLGHLARASGVSVEIDLDRLPLVDDVDAAAAAVSGEEYELVVAAPRAARLRPEEFAKRFDLSLTEIGVVRDALDSPVIVVGARVDPARGHDHFS
jgi:thiamine-monophosphate kinase